MVKMTSLQFSPIGYLRSPFKKRFGTPRQGVLTPSSRAWIELLPAYREGLAGLEEFSHVWIVSQLHHSETIQRVKIRPPRLRGKKRGVFSTRGPHRPNPLGLTNAKIEEVSAEGLWVSGVDLLDGTPILDLKPYISIYDSPSPSTFPAWIQKPQALELTFTAEFWEDFEKLPPLTLSKDRLLGMIKECLLYDPRPIAYLKRPQEIYYLELFEYEVEVLSEKEHFTVRKIFLKRETKPQGTK